MKSISKADIILGIFCLGLAVVVAEHKHKSQDKSADNSVYHGLIGEDAQEGDEVELNPPLLARDRTKLSGDEICGYTVYKSQYELPFKVVLQDRKSGLAKIVLAPGYTLNFERRHRYHFEVAAHDCDKGAHAKREGVFIQVTDVNEFAPRFTNSSYIVDVPEKEMIKNILQLNANDQDGSAEYASICHFHILTPNVPFEIDNRGVLKNTEPLDYSQNHNYILEVKAEDCGGPYSRTSDKVEVNIRVIQACKTGWSGIDERIEYAPGSNQLLIAENAKLNTCETPCKEQSVSARIELTTKHIGKGCDRDTYSIQSQRKLCGAASGSVDLLPSPSMSAWTKTLPTDDGQESDQIFSFDGKTNAIEIPSTKFNHSLSSHFTISTWMKHEQDPEDNSKHGNKEHILCNADGEEMSRHHYSLFVHNCRLVFLIRQEPEGADMNTFKPAEWRWKIPQVCDGQWHHYAISTDFPEVRLYIDGHRFVEQKNNPEIIDDWPLHKSNKIHFTKLVVGACWQGNDHKLLQYFRGYLAGLSILKGKTESDRVIKCLNNCKEKLEFHAMNEMDTGMSIAFNSEMTEITINGHNHTEVEKLVRRVGYINSRMFPTAGYRALKVETNIVCENGEKIEMPDTNSMIVVLQPEKPIITVTSTQSLARSEHDFIHGLPLFSDLTITSSTRKEIEETEVAEAANSIDEKVAEEMAKMTADRYQLDSCMVRIDPPLNLEKEHLKYPSNLISDMGLEASQTEQGLLIAGADKIKNYVEVLRHVMYVNRKPEDFNTRHFILTCSELNGRFVSNEFTVRVDILHTIHHASVPQAHADNGLEHKFEPIEKVRDLHLEETLGNNAFLAANVAHGGASVGMTVIIVVCVGFLIFMIVLGVIRIRAAHNRTQVVTVEEKQEMEWDNSALNITVNPMDQEGGATCAVFQEENELHVLRHANDSDSDEDDISDCDFHDDLESSEEESEKVKDRELEWDDSTLTF